MKIFEVKFKLTDTYTSELAAKQDVIDMLIDYLSASEIQTIEVKELESK